MRLLYSTRSALPSLASAALLLVTWAAPSHAAPFPDAVAIAQAYGELSVFVLNVAAGNDGQSRDPRAEQAFVYAFAQPVLAAYPDLPVDQQQALRQLVDLRDQVQQAWPSLPVRQRQRIQEQWAAAVEDGLTSVPCNVYDALARAYLLPVGPYFQSNVDRLVQCWNQHPELAWSRDGRNLAAQRAAQQSGGSDALYVGFMNAETTRYAGTMNMISIMSDDPYRWTVGQQP